MPMEAYHLPNFLSLLPKKPGGEINPHFKEVETAYNAWVAKKLDPSPATEIYKSDVPLLVSLAWPLASCQQLRGFLDFLTSLFFLDDLLEHCPSEATLALSQLWMKTLRDGDEEGSVQHPLIEMMRSELILGTRALVGSCHWPQFVTEYEKVVMHMVQEAHDRKVYLNKNATLDIQSYVIKRRFTIITRPCFVVIRSTRCLYIPDEVLARSVVQEMENAITDMIFISNDIHSFKKEYGDDGAFSNLLTVIQKDPETAHLDFQGRLDYAEKLFKAALDRLYACRRELPSFGPEMDQSLALYADGLIDFAVGSLQWDRVNRRYSTFMNEEDRRNNVVRLASE